MEIWLHIVSFIALEDRAEAWFSLRSLCRMSKIAIEDVFTRAYLPELYMIHLGPPRSTDFYLFERLCADGGLARFKERDIPWWLEPQHIHAMVWKGLRRDGDDVHPGLKRDPFW